VKAASSQSCIGSATSSSSTVAFCKGHKRSLELKPWHDRPANTQCHS
jgi:hypothetical protein